MKLDAVNWRAIVAPYQRADVRRAVVQLLNTLVPLAALLYVMYLSLAWSYWLTLALAVPTAGFLIRTFIIMHDCGHGSFLPSQKWNNLVGWITGVLTATPYAEWRHEHAIHHATAGDLDRRGHGDIATITVEEYLARDWWGRLRYRLYRHPALILGFGPLYLLIGQRIPGRVHSSGSPKTSSIWSTNLGMAAVITGLAMLIGIQSVLLVYLPVAYLAAGAGVYLFFVQHQFDQAYWEHHANWDYATAAVLGCSYLKLPRVLQWFTGNIGLHHVHHLAPRIPNYELQRAHDENPIFSHAPTFGLARSVWMLRLALWDEQHRRMIGFGDLRTLQRA
jgi:omega-6 fatty acid desaturase (delta-12 desaturase)